MSGFAVRFRSVAAAVAFAIGAPQESPIADGGAAEKEWRSIEDAVTPKLVAHRALPPEEQRKVDFKEEIERIEGFAGRVDGKDPDAAATARIFLATQLFAKAQHRAREAVALLTTVSNGKASPLVAGIATVNAGQLLLELGDEAALLDLRVRYSARPDRDGSFLRALDRFCIQARLAVGRAFPAMKLVALDGTPIDVGALRGKVVILLVFNVVNEPARTALAVAAGFAKNHRDDVAVVGVSLDTSRPALEKAVAELALPFPIDFAGKGLGGPRAEELGIAQIPATFVIDRAGVVIATQLRASGPALEQELDRLLAATPRTPLPPPKR